MGNENKIQIVVEAYDRAKTTFEALGRQIKGIGDETARTGQTGKGMLASMKENWIAVSAVVVAAGVAINKALDYMNDAAKDQQAEASFRSTAAAVGESADKILAAMEKAANGTMDASDIMQKATKGMMQGLSGSQLVQIMEAARVAARTTGEDVRTAYENITDALANKMPRGLIKYGLVTKEQMKLLEASMAAGVREVDLFKIAMANAADQSAKLGPITEDNSEKLQKLAAWWKELKKTIGEVIWSIISGIKSVAIGAVDVVMGLMSGAVAGIFGVFLAAETVLNKLGLRSNEELAKTRADFEKLKNMSKDFFKSAFGADEKKPKPFEGKPGPAGSRPGSGAEDLEAQMRAALAMKAREAEISKQIADLDIAEKNRDISHADAAKRRVDLTRELLEVQGKNLAQIDKEKNPQGWASQQKAIDDTNRKLAELNLTLREFQGSFTEGVNEGFARYLDTVRSRFQEGVYLAQQAAQGMEQAFSDFFFDVMTGKLKSFWDYIKNFLMSVARAVANIMAQRAASSIVGAFSGGGGEAGGVAATSGEGMTSTGFINMPAHHDGGLIMHQGGYVPRFHIGGLSSDERPAILQTGEYVVSRKGVAALDRINGGDAGGGMNITVQIENRSSQPVQGKQGGTSFDGKSYVVGVVISDIEQGGPIRSAIKGLR